VELLADELGLDDDGEILGDDVGFADLLGFGLTEVARTVDGSTVLGTGLVVTDGRADADDGTADELRCCTVLPTSPLV
jgi:hypothetical protein